MCGICGFSGEANHDLLAKMGDAIRHRGPDDCGSFYGLHMSLCSRRLRILDLALGMQPAHNEDSSVICVWNGEIYNYRELIVSLKKKGHVFYSDHSDSELIVHLYEEYGKDFVKKLNGMFAIALFDLKKERLFLIRDRMGIKPLYYFYDGKDIVFASEIKSILLHPAYRKQINVPALYDYFSFQHISSPDTAFEKIYALRPGTMLIFEHGNPNLYPYFSLSFPNTCKDSLPVAIEKTKALLTDAVRIRLSADVEVGSFLSGGLDSSLITALAAKDDAHRLKTFCLRHEASSPGDLYHKEEDDRCARLVAEQNHTEHFVTVMKADDIITDMEHIIHAFDQPFAASASTYFLSKEVATHVKVALSGDGADELFGSYPLQQLAFPMQYFSKMMREGRTTDELDASMLLPFSKRLDYLKNLYDFSGGNEILTSYRLLNMTDADKSLFLSEEVFGKLIAEKSTLLRLKELFSQLDGGDVLNRSLHYFSETFLPDQVLTYQDTLSMANSLELRSPFLDYRLVSYVNSLPGSYKIRNGETKYLLRRAAKGVLSEDIINRTKEGFLPPIHDWLRLELKEYVTDSLTLSRIRAFPFLKPESILFLLHKYYADPIANDYLADLIWNFLMFQKWCEEYV